MGLGCGYQAPVHISMEMLPQILPIYILLSHTHSMRALPLPPSSHPTLRDFTPQISFRSAAVFACPGIHQSRDLRVDNMMLLGLHPGPIHSIVELLRSRELERYLVADETAFPLCVRYVKLETATHAEATRHVRNVHS